MWTNCDDVQHAVQPLQGTSESRSSRSAARIPAIHDEKSPAASSGSLLTILLCGYDERPDHLVVPRLLGRVPQHPEEPEAAHEPAHELGEVPTDGAADTDRRARPRVEHP